MYDVRRYAGARRDLGGIEVRDQAQGGLILGTGASGNVRSDIGVFGYMGISCTQISQKLGKHVGKV